MAMINQPFQDTSGSGSISINNSTSNTSIQQNTNTFTISQGSFQPSRSQGNPCNESKRHDNDEKAIFHGMKSAYRMSRDKNVGTQEYGSDNPQYEHAARMAAQTAMAYLKAKDKDYDREESFEYIRENIVGDPRTVDRVLSFLGIRDSPDGLDDGLASRHDLEDGIDKAWTQIDKKENHYDGARTALAIAEAYLGEEFW